MPFETGSIGFRLYHTGLPIPEDAVARFARHAAPAIQTLASEPIQGWVTSRHLLDRNIVPETALVAGYLRLDLMRAERKVPPALLRAECRIEELAEAEARGVDFLSRKSRMAIRRAVVDRLLPTMPPQLKGIPFAASRDADTVYAGALSPRQMDAFELAWRESIGRALSAITPESYASRVRQIDTGSVDPVSFSPEVKDEQGGKWLGEDFLTWLWYVSETRGGTLESGRHGTFGVLLEGPLLFAFEGGGAHEAVLRKGSPLTSVEARTALLGGKKLRQAHVHLAQDKVMWSLVLDAREFVFRGVRLPDVESQDPAGRLQERMLHLEKLVESLLAFYDQFLSERLSTKRWKAERPKIHHWASQREARA